MEGNGVLAFARHVLFPIFADKGETIIHVASLRVCLNMEIHVVFLKRKIYLSNKYILRFCDREE